MEEPNIFRIKLSTQKVPEFKDQTGKDYILYGTEQPWRNTYPDYLVHLYCLNSKHAAIINGKTHYICGNGWEVKEKTVGGTMEVQSFMEKANDDESMDDLTRKVVLDFEMNDGFAIEVIWSKDKKRPYFYHVPFNRVRSNKDHSEFYYSLDWSKSQPDKEEYDWKTWKAFDPKKKENSLYYFYLSKPVKAGNLGTYPYPNYIGAAASIETGIEISNFHLNKIKNNFWGSFWITIMNSPTPEERDKSEEKIKEKFAGTDNAGEIVLEFAQSSEKAAKFQSIDMPDLHNMFIELRKDVDQDLITGHQIPSGMLFGIKTEGQLGGRTEMLETYEIFKNTYINCRQRIIESEFNKFIKWLGFSATIKLKAVEPIIDKFSEAVVTKVMTTDEIREKAGLPKLKEGEIVQPEEMDDKTLQGQCISYMINEGKTQEQAVSICYHNPKAHLTSQVKMRSTEKDGDVVKEFAKFGVKKEGFEILESEGVEGHDFKAAEDGEFRLMGKHFALKGKVDKDGKGTTTITNIQVMYSYEVRPGYGPELIDTSRELCVELIRLDRLYTRADIEQISSQVGFNVWEHTGGYYHKPGGKTYDHCRHRWERHLVKTIS